MCGLFMKSLFSFRNVDPGWCIENWFHKQYCEFSFKNKPGFVCAVLKLLGTVKFDCNKNKIKWRMLGFAARAWTYALANKNIQT